MTANDFSTPIPDLTDNLGHHANNCRFITREARARGMDVKVLLFREHRGRFAGGARRDPASSGR